VISNNATRTKGVFGNIIVYEYEKVTKREGILGKIGRIILMLYHCELLGIDLMLAYHRCVNIDCR
jgi:hypothetical protein